MRSSIFSVPDFAEYERSKLSGLVVAKKAATIGLLHSSGCESFTGSSLNAIDLLAIFAELAVSFVGFASIVAAIQSLSGRSWSALDKLLFRSLIEISLVVLFLSLIPLAMSSAGIEAGVIWVSCSALALAVGLAATVVRSVMNRRYLGRQPRVGLYIAVPLAVVSLALNITNILVWRTATSYVFVMLLVVLMASAMFLNLVINLFPLGDRSTPK
jgi:hypothetical protein